MISIWVLVFTFIILVGMVIHQWWKYRTLLECYKCTIFYLDLYIKQYGQSFEMCDRIINDAENKE
jgi:hypothetical protein